MGRPRQFSEVAAVAAAAGVFAHRGFAGTSVDDLVRATGVNRASLYGVFGSKDGLFRRCLATGLDLLTAGNGEGGTDRSTHPAAEADAGADGGARYPDDALDRDATLDRDADVDRRTALDLVLVTLMELTPDDPALAAALTQRLAAAGVASQDLGARALQRAEAAARPRARS